MQKALIQMNLHIHKVISDITGTTGMVMLRAIVGGERDPQKLEALKDSQIKSSTKEIAKVLSGDYRLEHLFVLKQELTLYEVYQKEIAALRCPESNYRHRTKIVFMFYYVWTTAGQYSDPGMDYYEQKYNEQILKNLRNKAHPLGLELVSFSQDTQKTPSSQALAK